VRERETEQRERERERERDQRWRDGVMEFGEGERDPVTIVAGRDRLDPRKRAVTREREKTQKGSGEPREVRSSMIGGQNQNPGIEELRRNPGA
jgi:hypothetical protein